MGNTSGNKDNKMAGQEKRCLNIGILAHVDAGKTTLSEGMLYLSGSIRTLGRVDHGDAFLDMYSMERERGITIFSKQAVMKWKNMEFTLLDTPGHVDFSAEMERVLQVLDYAVLVISGADGVQGHTVTLWRLLKRYKVPVFLFINKMDQEGTDRNALMSELKKMLDEGCTDFQSVFTETGAENAEKLENLAVCDDEMLEEYLENGTIRKETLQRVIAKRKVFPCWFGSALKAEGVEKLLDGIREYALCPQYPAIFGAKVYKIARDSRGNRLTYLKVTGGALDVKEILPGTEGKVNQIRVYSGDKYELIQRAEAGRVCAVTGLEGTYPGQGLGAEKDSDIPVLEPVLTYRVELPEGCDVHAMLVNLRRLEEEEPELHVVWVEETQEIHVQLMGEVQTEVLQHLIKERYGVLAEFREGKIIYKETITKPVEGVGHFEPLRHYAEVHLLLEPGERGSGMQFSSECSEDILDRNWQRLILTHLDEKEHRGVLTGSMLTDVRITLISGRAHQKHTEGGDFRQATYRAVRQGLRKAKSVLLEPYYEFRMELPVENVGRAMTDIQRMNGTFEGPETEDSGHVVLTGRAPVSEMRGYQKEFAAYTGGFGRMFCSLKGYDVCHNAEDVIEKTGYDPDSDIENTADSVFCAHGAGFIVPWYEVEEYMHVESGMKEEDAEAAAELREERKAARTRASGSPIELTQEELDAIYVRTPDPVRKNVSTTPIKVSADFGAERRREQSERPAYRAEDKRKRPEGEEYLLVDGYNIIFAWDELRELSETDLAAARGKLADILCNYQGYRKCTLILVFDAYKVEGNPGEVSEYHNIHIVYTKEAETADQYIEKTVRKISRKHSVTVATSDALEQVIILGQGAQRMSAAGLKEEVELALQEIRGEHLGSGDILRTYLFDCLEEDEAKKIEQMRLGMKNWPV